MEEFSDKAEVMRRKLGFLLNLKLEMLCSPREEAVRAAGE